MISTSCRSSMRETSRRFSLKRKVATSTGTSATSLEVESFIASSSSTRSTVSAVERRLRIVPTPSQRGQRSWLNSAKEGRRRWRDISSKPKREMRPIWTRARSIFTQSRILFSTARWFLADIMSMKSMTTKPPRSRNRNWVAISSAASRLVRSAVSSISLPCVARAELMSMVISASVGSMTSAPPLGRRTSRLKAVSI